MNTLFDSVKVTPQGLEDMAKCRQQLNDLLVEIEPLCSSGRELALARTHLEATGFYLVKSIALKNEKV